MTRTEHDLCTCCLSVEEWVAEHIDPGGDIPLGADPRAEADYILSNWPWPGEAMIDAEVLTWAIGLYIEARAEGGYLCASCYENTPTHRALHEVYDAWFEAEDAAFADD